MLRTHWSYSAKAAVNYLALTDYYATSPGELLGKGFEHLDIGGKSARNVFECLAHNIDPGTGELLRPSAREGDRVGMDFTFNATKSVSIAREMGGPDHAGDPFIEQAHREAVAYTMSLIEAEVQTRVRGGRDGDRTTGNLMAYRVTHRDTRINADDQMPDPALHDHVFVINTTFDKIEGQWKACQLAQIKHDAPYFEAIYQNRLASNLWELGYGIRRDGKAFEIAGIDRPLIEKFSRRTQYIKAVAAKLGITNPESLSKLGATTRLGKSKELADDLNGYYVSRLTEKEKQQLGALDGQPSYESNEQEAVRYAIGHMFERKSVVDEKRLYETAIRFGIGSVTPEGIIAEAHRQGVLTRDGEATTKEVLAEEARVIAFAREGKGTCGSMGKEGRTEPVRSMRPLASQISSPMPEQSGNRTHANGGYIDTATSTALSQQKGRPDESKRPLLSAVQHTTDRNKFDTAILSPEQQAVVSETTDLRTNRTAKSQSGSISELSPDQLRIALHVWDSTDRVILIRGAAGTGKTHTMRTTIEGLDRPTVVLAPSAEASRGVLRREGFSQADTVARFLQDSEFRQQAKNGVIWVDEAGQLGIRQVAQVFDRARELNARVVLQGDRRQHGSVERGATLRVMEEYAGLPVAELRDIRRQRGQYKSAVEALSKGKMLEGYDQLTDLGWVKHVDGNTAIVDDYLGELKAGKSVLVVAPTHAEGDSITASIRDRLKLMGVVGEMDMSVEQLRPLNWTEAERGDLERYDGSQVMVFHRNSGTFKAGQRVHIADWKPGDRYASAAHFSVYEDCALPVAAGDTIRITGNGKTKDGHKLNNGSVYEVKGFSKHGEIVLENGWVVPAAFGHIAHGYVSTSHASQGKTVDRVLIAMGKDSLPAMGAEQFYVSVSRGKESAKVYSDLAPSTLREAIQRIDHRKSATELFKPKPKKKSKLRSVMKQARERFKRLHEKVINVTKDIFKQKERDAHER